jgi:uncharacterized SAM-binding protein YcdF (DUF218 family)
MLRHMARQRWVRLLIAALAVVFVLCTALAVYLYSYGQADHAARADVIVILGGGTEADGTASPATTRRVEHGAALYQRGLAPWVLCTGGYTENHPQSEARACADLAQREGVPAAAILMEENSTSTEENAIETRKVMAAYHLNTALVVSDNFHLYRAEMLFHVYGITTFMSPAQVTAGPLEWWRAVWDSYREAAALSWYVLKTALGLPLTSTKSVTVR